MLIPVFLLSNVDYFFSSFTDPPPSLPFQIRRSRTNNLPVYIDKKRGGSLVLTVIKNIKGDLNVRITKLTLPYYTIYHFK